eukprot:3517216-Pyramimonas_sp.AAC.1
MRTASGHPFPGLNSNCSPDSLKSMSEASRGYSAARNSSAITGIRAIGLQFLGREGSPSLRRTWNFHTSGGARSAATLSLHSLV